LNAKLGNKPSRSKLEVSSDWASRDDTLLGWARRSPSQAGLWLGSGMIRLSLARKARSQLGNYIL